MVADGCSGRAIARPVGSDHRRPDPVSVMVSAMPTSATGLVQLSDIHLRIHVPVDGGISSHIETVEPTGPPPGSSV